MSDGSSESATEGNVYKRSIDWKQGIFITMGVPVLVLPSIGYLAGYVWAAAILIWAFAILQGFLQVTAFGELATAFPDESGLPGYSQRVFVGNSESNDYSFGKLVGGFSAWGYWFGWNAVIAIYAITATSTIQGLLPNLAGINNMYLSLVVCFVIMAFLTIVVSRGIGMGYGWELPWRFFPSFPLRCYLLALSSGANSICLTSPVRGGPPTGNGTLAAS